MNRFLNTADNHFQFSGKVGGAYTVFEGQPWQLTGGGYFNLNDLPMYPNGCLPAATPIYFDEETRKVQIHYAFKVAEAVSNKKTVKIAKGYWGSTIKEGMTLMVAQADVNTAADATYRVDTVDRNNEEYDLVTLSAAITAAEGAVLWEANEDKKIKVVPNALTDRDKVHHAEDFMVDCNPVFGSTGAVLIRRIAPITDAIIKALRENQCYFRFDKHK